MALMLNGMKIHATFPISLVAFIHISISKNLDTQFISTNEFRERIENQKESMKICCHNYNEKTEFSLILSKFPILSKLTEN